MKQGITLPIQAASTSDPLPVPKEPPPAVTVAEVADPHVFTLPPNTAGQGKSHQQRQAMPPQPPPTQDPGMHAHPLVPLVLPSPLGIIQLPGASAMVPVPMPSAVPFSTIPASTQSYRKRTGERMATGRQTKKYKSRSGPIKCSKCGKERSKGHKQYFGNWYCPDTSTQKEEEWRAALTAKGYKKKDE